MKAWIVSRRLRLGSEQEFRDRWSKLQHLDGLTSAWLLKAEDDPNEVLSISLLANDEKLHRYRTELDTQSRLDLLGETSEAQWQRSFELWAAPRRNSLQRYWPLLPGLAAVASAFGYFQKRRQNQIAETMTRSMLRSRRLWFILPSMLTASGAGLVLLFRRRSVAGASVGTERVEPMASISPAASASAAAPTPLEPTPQSTDSRRRLQQSRLLVRDVMTPRPETVEYDANLATAAAKMRDLNIGVLPVMADGQLSGIITDRDLALSLAEGTDALAGRRVHDAMSSVPVTVNPSATVQEASELMAAHQVRRLPVVEGTELVGMLSLGDLAAQGLEAEAGSALEDISEPAEPQR